jgi:hypothetical protein
MRVASWFPGWLIRRFSRLNRLWIAVLSNTAALALFAGILITQRLPGEIMDLSALTFGVVVFFVYAVIDVKWTK